MAGSFGVFRQYEKAALAALAIMAMLAFFVLPPFLQMNAGAGGSDPMAVSWNGGGLRESGLQRAVIMRKVMNQFLVETMAASGQDPSRMRLADDEKDVVDTILLAKEAEKNGIVVSNAAINQFLSEWTNDLVRPETFNGIVNQIGGRMGVSQQDVFEALRTVLMARRMESLLVGGVGFEGAPPGWRWDYYRRLEQGATIETVPVVVEKFVDKLPEPAEPALRAFFEKYKDELPAARSPDPGFRQPHRARYDYLVAKAGMFQDDEKKKVTDEQINAFYEERKAALYKVKPADDATATGARMPRANMTAVLDFELSVPPLLEQRRIVAILDEAFEGIATAKANAEKNLRNARELFETTIARVFGQRSDLWRPTKLADAFVTLTGNTPSKSNAAYFGDFTPLVKPPELLDDYIADVADGLSEAGAEVARVLPANSVLVSCIGNLGKVGINDAPVACNQQINAILPDEGTALPEFMFFQALSMPFKDQLAAAASGTTVPIVNKSKFNQTEIVLPPLEEQAVVVEALWKLRYETGRLAVIHGNKLAALDELKKSLLHQAFSGAL